MKNEISELLQGVSKDDFEKFGDFIKSPYFNKLPRLVKLYDYLNENYNKPEQEAITRESISRFMYPNEEFKNESIRKLLSDFAKLLDKFLAQEEFEKNVWDKNIYTLRGLRTRNYDDKFFKRLKEFKSQHANSSQEIDEFYETNTKLISEEYDFRFASKFGEKNEINQEKSDALDFEFIAKKLYLFQYMLSREYVNNDLKFRYDFLEEISAYIERNRTKIIRENPELYRNLLGINFIMENYDEGILSQLKSFIDEMEYWEKKKSQPYWDYINYCVVKVNQGFDNYFNEIFHYISLLDSNGLIIPDKSFNHNSFRISASAAIHCKETQWLEKFIVKYKSKIEKEYRNDIVNLTYARLYFEIQDFNRSKQFCGQVTFKNYIFYLAAKNILLKIAFELGNILDIIALKDAYVKYFESHSEIPSVYKTGKIEFANYLLKLAKIKENFEFQKTDNYELDKFIKNLSADTIVNNKEWLLEKVSELKHNSRK